MLAHHDRHAWPYDAIEKQGAYARSVQTPKVEESHDDDRETQQRSPHARYVERRIHAAQPGDNGEAPAGST